MKNKVIMITGLPASGKSSEKQCFNNDEYVYLSRDCFGGSTMDLLPIMKKNLQNNKNIILDNIFATKEIRKPFIDLAKQFNISIECLWKATIADDCQINALIRMYKKYGKVFLHPNDLKEVKNDVNMFPISVIFKFKKQYEPPTINEGFSIVNKISFQRKWSSDFKQKAIFLDYDGTVRECVNGNGKFPTEINHIKIFNNVSKTIKQYQDAGYLIFGISNQSGIAKGLLTTEKAEYLFKETNKMLNIDIPVYYCPHTVPPVCYCRKPQSGLLIPLILKHKINVKDSIVVGDQTSDKTTAKRLNMNFFYPNQFFNW